MSLWDAIRDFLPRGDAAPPLILALMTEQSVADSDSGTKEVLRSSTYRAFHAGTFSSIPRVNHLFQEVKDSRAVANAPQQRCIAGHGPACTTEKTPVAAAAPMRRRRVETG
jgi:hypothetical protein